MAWAALSVKTYSEPPVRSFWFEISYAPSSERLLLVLSVRTVETQVYRAMQKRGVSDRRDL